MWGLMRCSTVTGVCNLGGMRLGRAHSSSFECASSPVKAVPAPSFRHHNYPMAMMACCAGSSTATSTATGTSSSTTTETATASATGTVPCEEWLQVHAYGRWFGASRATFMQALQRALRPALRRAPALAAPQQPRRPPVQVRQAGTVSRLVVLLLLEYH